MTRRVGREELRAAIYDKYIRPVQRPESKRVGVEFEFPIVNRKKEAVDFNVVHAATDAFIREFGFVVTSVDADGNINMARSEENGDDLSYDCSYNTLEFSFGVEEDINVLSRRFAKYYRFMQETLGAHQHQLVGMGINPYYELNRNEPIPTERYRMLLHHLESYEKYKGLMHFHDVPYFGLIGSASQVHVDVSEENVVRTINAFNKLEPLKALLFANSPWGDMLASRDYFWRHSMHGFNPHNVDGYAKDLASIDEVVSYYSSMSLYCVERNGKYINFEPTPLEAYFNKAICTGEYFDGTQYQSVEWTPELSDLAYLRSFKFEDLTFRGTVEFRSTCEQPVSEVFATTAFHVGLKTNLDQLEARLAKAKEIYEHGYSAEELRNLFVRKELPSFYDKAYTAELLVDLLDIARAGLAARGFGEEHFLDPLYARAKNVLSPAREWITGMQNGKSLEYYIDKFSEL